MRIHYLMHTNKYKLKLFIKLKWEIHQLKDHWVDIVSWAHQNEEGWMWTNEAQGGRRK